MKRYIACALALGALALCLRPVPAIRAAAPSPPRCGDAGKNPRVAFAVLGDGFTSQGQHLLEVASAELLCEGALMNERAYKTHSEQMMAETIMVSSATDTIARQGQTPGTALEIVYNGSPADCFFTTSADAQKKITYAASNAMHRQILVIVNIRDQDAGCTEGAVTYITRGARWQTIAHEIGHILGLRDEYADLDGAGPAILDHTNCSTNPAAWWLNEHLSGAGAIKECNRYPGAYRAYNDCRMRARNQELCLVCERLIDEQFATFHTTSSPPPAPAPAVQLALRLRLTPSPDAPPGVDVVVSSDVIAAPDTQPPAAAGHHVAVMLVNGQVASVADVSRTFDDASQLVRRAYGGTRPFMHRDLPAAQAIEMVMVPQMTKAELKTRQVDFKIVRVGSAPPPVISKQWLDGPGVRTIVSATNLQTQIQ